MSLFDRFEAWHTYQAEGEEIRQRIDSLTLRLADAQAKQRKIDDEHAAAVQAAEEAGKPLPAALPRVDLSSYDRLLADLRREQEQHRERENAVLVSIADEALAAAQEERDASLREAADLRLRASVLEAKERSNWADVKRLRRALDSRNPNSMPTKDHGLAGRTMPAPTWQSLLAGVDWLALAPPPSLRDTDPHPVPLSDPPIRQVGLIKSVGLGRRPPDPPPVAPSRPGEI